MDLSIPVFLVRAEPCCNLTVRIIVRRSRQAPGHDRGTYGVTVVTHRALGAPRLCLRRTYDSQIQLRSAKVVTSAAPGARRSFLKAAIASPRRRPRISMISKGQASPISMRFQSTWPTKDIFHEYALDYAKKGERHEPAATSRSRCFRGSVVPAFGLLDAVSKGTLDGGHGVLASTTASKTPWRCGIGSGGGIGCQHGACVAQIRRRQAVAR